MKTNQIMVREFAGQTIRQQHITGMFSANDMANLFPGKNLQDWKDKQTTREFILTIMGRENITEEQVIWESGKKRGDIRGTWLHPYLAIDLAMWLSPDFKYDVIKWVYDQLCESRNAAGDNHKMMCDAIHEVLHPIDGYVYADETYMVQSLAGIETGGRNGATEGQLKLLSTLQMWNSRMLRKGLHNRVTRRSKLIELREFTLDDSAVL